MHCYDQLPRISARELESTIRTGCVPFETEVFGEGAHVLYLLPEACQELYQLVCFGKKRAANAYEQQFIGMGHTFRDEKDCVRTVVTRVIPIQSASRGPAHAQVISEGNDRALEILANERRLQNQLEQLCNTDEYGWLADPLLGFGPSRTVLFGHTHPGLGCTFSSVDHRSNYSTPAFPMVTFVCDPIRRDMKAMVGIHGSPMAVRACRPRPLTLAEQKALGTDTGVERLWRRISAGAALLLRQSGVFGNVECYRDSRGRTHMKLYMTYRPGRKGG